MRAIHARPAHVLGRRQAQQYSSGRRVRVLQTTRMRGTASRGSRARPVASAAVLERQRGSIGAQRAHAVVPHVRCAVVRLGQVRLARQRPAPWNAARGQRSVTRPND